MARRPAPRPRLWPAAAVILLAAWCAAGCGERKPVLLVSKSEMSFGNGESHQTFDVKNGGEDGLLVGGVAPLHYELNSDQSWITINPASGSCGEGQRNAHVVEIRRDGLPLGDHTATIRIVSNAGPWAITVRALNTEPPCTDLPTEPANPGPDDGATNRPVGTDLAWEGGESQCTGLAATYHVYFGTNSSPPLRDSTDAPSWDPGPLEYATTYYWKIVATDANGSAEGPVWSFRTAPVPCSQGPSSVTLNEPSNGAVLVPTSQDLKWSGGNSRCPGLNATYEVYFGTSSPPPFHHDNGDSKSWDPGTLELGKTYYWKIVARDDNGSVSSPTWSFTTVLTCITPPTEACSPTPADYADDVDDDTDLSWGCGDSQCQGTVTYDVYFGRDPSPDNGEFLGSTTNRHWSLPRLNDDTTYYWKVVTRDARGSTTSRVWRFQTAED